MDNCNCGFGASIPKFGTPGATFIPKVTETKDAVELSWTNNRGLPNPDPVKIPKGGSNSSGGNVDQGGLSSTASALLITILRNGVYSTDQSANITALEAALASSGESGGETPDDTEKTLTSISATYSGGDVEVGTDLTALTGIVVTATYDDGSTATVADYTLSGTIAEGSNTVTVSYGGKTTTFAVTGVAESGGETSEVLYELAEPTTFDGTNAIATDVMFSDTDKDYTVVGDFKFDGAIGTGELLRGMKTSNSIGLRLYFGTSASAYAFRCLYNAKYDALTQNTFTNTGEQTCKFVVVRTASNNTLTANTVINGVRSEEKAVVGLTAFSANTDKMTIGNFTGAINHLKIYNRALTSEEVEAYLA